MGVIVIYGDFMSRPMALAVFMFVFLALILTVAFEFV